MPVGTTEKFNMHHTIRPSLFSLIAICTVASSPIAFGAQPMDAAAVEAQFKASDANHDGKLSPAEHANGAKKMFSMMDANKDGTVTVAEMDAGHAKKSGENMAKTDTSSADMIKTCDTNSDGSLSTAEHTAGAVAMFEKMDSDKDGFVSRAECLAGHAAMMPKSTT